MVLPVWKIPVAVLSLQETLELYGNLLAGLFGSHLDSSVSTMRRKAYAVNGPLHD